MIAEQSIQWGIQEPQVLGGGKVSARSQMPMKTTYLVPDYLPAFQCKMGACRHPCCEGWPISMSTEDYFRLLSVSCGPAMRERLDNAVRVSLHPTPEAYAQIAPTWTGDCPLHLPDGRCAVHAMLGADALPTVCRLYPRGIRTEDGCECACANSCEAVIETMMRQKEPIRFIKAELDIRPPKDAEREFFFETVGRAQEIRLYFIRIMQERMLALPQRLMKLGEALRQMDEALKRKDEKRVGDLLGDAELAVHDLPQRPNRAHALSIACAVLERIDGQSGSVRAHGEAALALLGGADGRAARYEAAERHLDEALPDWPIAFEHALVNHMFFEQFPFQDRDEGLCDEFVAICAVYAVLRVLCVCAMAGQNEQTAFVDALAATFRLIDHTAFDRYGAHLLKALGCADEAGLAELVTL